MTGSAAHAGPIARATSEQILIVNEFVEVRVRPVRTRNGAGLEIYSARTQDSATFDAFALDLLANLRPEDLMAVVQRQYDEGQQARHDDGQ